MLLADGSRVAAADTMSELWTGQPVPNRSPVISPIQTVTTTAAPGQLLRATIDVKDPEGDPLQAEWYLKFETRDYGVGGDAEATPEHVRDAVVTSKLGSALLRMPDRPERYRLLVTVRDGQGGAATADIPLLVSEPVSAGAGARCPCSR